MSELQNRLKSLQPYLVQLRFPDGQPVVDMVFKKGWSVPKSEVIQSTKGDSKEVNYHMFFSNEDGINLDQILDYIQKVIGLNIEREKKHELLKVKAKELQEVFKTNPLSKLIDMKFVIGGEPLVEEMVEDELDVVDFDIETPVVERAKPKPVSKPQPEAVTKPQPEAVTETQEVVEAPVVDDPNVRRAPNGEIIPPLTPVDTGELDEDFKKFDLTSDDEPITKRAQGRNIDLPKKKKPVVELLEIESPTDIVCKCGPEDVCPACEEQKIGSY